MILDQYGNRIETKTLKTPQATPAQSGVRRIGQHASTSGLDPLKVARILRAAEEGDTAAYLSIAEEMEEKYPHYNAQLSTRKRAVSGIVPTVTPASDDPRDVEIADFIRARIPVIRAATSDMLDALGKGFSVCEILWDTEGPKWVPTSIVWRDPRWFVFDRVDGETLRLKSDQNRDGEPLRPAHHIIHKTAAKSGLPIRGGLARGAVWAFLFQNFSIRDWVTFIEQFGKPLILGRYDGAVEEKDLSVLFEAVRSLGSDAAAILPNSMTIEFPEAARAKGDSGLWLDLMEYLDRQVSKLVLGQTLTADTSSSGGGAYALGAIHNEVRLDILEDDAGKLAETINRDLIHILVNLNFPNVGEYPRYNLFVSKPEDLTAKAAIVETAVRIGQPVPVKWFSETFGIPLPEEGEAVLGEMTPPSLDWKAVHDKAFETAKQYHFADPDKMVALHAAGSHAPDAASASVDRLEADTREVMEEWLETIEAMLSAAGSLEEFQAMLLAAFPKLESGAMARKLAEAFTALELRGRFEVSDG
ncbi:MAG: DUF935 domain-containing protein [Zoogloeaceae bacterium]|nr:DUF935 domain-containing protein [Zoogloeaceae bacterium]